LIARVQRENDVGTNLDRPDAAALEERIQTALARAVARVQIV
jgi:hypothetical protein